MVTRLSDDYYSNKLSDSELVPHSRERRITLKSTLKRPGALHMTK